MKIEMQSYLEAYSLFEADVKMDLCFLRVPFCILVYLTNKLKVIVHYLAETLF